MVPWAKTAMIETSHLLHQLTQHPTINVYARCFGEGEPERQRPATPHRHPYYLLLYVAQGQSQQGVDLQEVAVKAGEVFLMVPHQIHVPAKQPLPPGSWQLVFDDECVARLPQAYPFLRNPWHQPVFGLAGDAQSRVQVLVEAVQTTAAEARRAPAATSLLLAYLHTLLCELNYAYFQAESSPVVEASMRQFGHFKQLVDEQFAHQPSVSALAQAVGVSGRVLGRLVQRYTGVSPKQYLHRRLVLEAQRLLLHGPLCSVKEVAYRLGFNDPHYFSRLFRQQTGQSVTEFVQLTHHSSPILATLSSAAGEG
ncbi:AraC family transcriptional regulator [Hymenobacter glaciei]|uniref:AraC family transcriptional regulator n=2 Tax=Hymenobacter glaciei TaxID=877209 RepID=A0ABP7UN92_9BACT